MEASKFQFKGYKVHRSLFHRDININERQLATSEILIGFAPKGFIDKEKSSFKLHLGVKVHNENKSFNIEVDTVADFEFEKGTDVSNLRSYFYLNAPALLFPYIRAYISTLTTLSGVDPINLPTLNLKKIGEELEKNTEIISG